MPSRLRLVEQLHAIAAEHARAERRRHRVRREGARVLEPREELVPHHAADVARHRRRRRDRRPQRELLRVRSASATRTTTTRGSFADARPLAPPSARARSRPRRLARGSRSTRRPPAPWSACSSRSVARTASHAAASPHRSAVEARRERRRVDVTARPSSVRSVRTPNSATADRRALHGRAARTPGAATGLGTRGEARDRARRGSGPSEPAWRRRREAARGAAAMPTRRGRLRYARVERESRRCDTRRREAPGRLSTPSPNAQSLAGESRVEHCTSATRQPPHNPRVMPLPPAARSVRPALEHDACGLGFVADLRRAPTHEVVAMGIEILRRLAHRGAAGCDPCSSDGAGILIQIPHARFERTLAYPGIELPLEGDYGVAQCFLSRDPEVCARRDAHPRGRRPPPQPEGHRLARRPGRRERARPHRARVDAGRSSSSSSGACARPACSSAPSS